MNKETINKMIENVSLVVYAMLDKPHSHAKTWIHNGIIFGYPLCCIKAFCEESELKNRSKRQLAMGARTGFIPCLACTQKLLSGKVILGDLIQNRLITAPFPKGTSTVITVSLN